MDVRDAFYHGIRQQIRRVLTLLGDERIDKGLTAFEDGSKDWGNCFFARAFMPERIHSEYDVCDILGLVDGKKRNVVPVRIVYRTFDECSTMITREQLRDFIVSVRDESRPDEVMSLLKSLNYKDVETQAPREFETCKA